MHVHEFPGRMNKYSLSEQTKMCINITNYAMKMNQKLENVRNKVGFIQLMFLGHME